MTREKATLATLMALLAAAACAPGEQAATEEEAEEPAAAPAETAAEPQLPDTTAEAVWAYLEAEGYQGWQHWPGKGELYPGSEPHGALLTNYVNAVAAEALASGTATAMPAGSIVVKENYMPDSALAAVTVMYKVPGFNPDHSDWWFLKRNVDGSVEVAGRGEGCQNCHRGVAANDYIFTSPIGG